MAGEKLSDAIVYEKLNLLKRISLAISGATRKKRRNLPVFYGHVVSALEILFRISRMNRMTNLSIISRLKCWMQVKQRRFEYVRKVIHNAFASKRKRCGNRGQYRCWPEITKNGDYPHAIDYLKNYRDLDAKMACSSILLSYSSLREFRSDDESAKTSVPVDGAARPGTLLHLAAGSTASRAGGRVPRHRGDRPAGFRCGSR